MRLIILQGLWDLVGIRSSNLQGPKDLAGKKNASSFDEAFNINQPTVEANFSFS
ncbi:hypothetical protein [Psychroserpens ponticola]|uniref:Uncharacterized protein n=1 Tax=Psychroserpens ponticola TaxID=2932268 RepID=A0ABY7RXH6_9FLAO|nr:hypothetical protein [Psychroserpens ponticola]WCO01386.1 hypothetical protein MUN68_015130 [Psychroserpens ponticola]